MTVTVDTATGTVHVGDDVISGVRDASDIVPGALRLRSGAIVRPLAFGVRAQVCARARDPVSLAAAVLAAAVGTSAAARPSWDDSDETALQALALHLAGAEADGSAPSFADVAVVMRRTYGWDVSALLDVQAPFADQLASAALADGDDDWTRVVLVQAATSAAQVRDQLGSDLLRRAAARLSGGLDEQDADDPNELGGATGRVDDARSGLHTHDPPPVTDTEVGGRETPSRHARHLDAPSGEPWSPDATATAGDRARPSTGAGGVGGNPAMDDGGVGHAASRAERHTDPSPAAAPGATAPRDRAAPTTRGLPRPSSRRLDIHAGTAAGSAEPATGGIAAADASTGVRRGVARGPSLRQVRSGFDLLPAAAADKPHSALEADAPARLATPTIGLAERIAAALDDESDLRGIRRW